MAAAVETAQPHAGTEPRGWDEAAYRRRILQEPDLSCRTLFRTVFFDHHDDPDPFVLFAAASSDGSPASFSLSSCISSSSTQTALQICNIVVIARYLNVTLVMPRLDKPSFWNDPSEFQDIFDAEHFITSLRDEVHILRELPPKVKRRVELAILNLRCSTQCHLSVGLISPITIIRIQMVRKCCVPRSLEMLLVVFSPGIAVGVIGAAYTPAIDIWSTGCIFAELLTGRPLIPGKNIVHQLDLVIDLLGSPSSETLSRIRNEKARRYLGCMREKHPVPFTQKFPSADPWALRLLGRLLAFDPKDRSTAEESLADTYFASLANAEREPPRHPNSKLEFEFERQMLTKDDVRASD